MLFGKKHVDRYVATGGEEGHEWQPGVFTLILTTTGRRSGEPRPTPLIYGESADGYVVVASKGGADQPPAWYVNLLEHPEVHVQVLDDRFPATARTASAEEKARLWPMMAAIWPAYDDYQLRTEREIPVVVLERERGG
jgi:deazaflavin-dependent oxidoreductase (nitroreductase family)